MSAPIRLSLYTSDGTFVTATTLFTVWHDVASNLNILHDKINSVRDEIMARYPTARYVSPDTTPDFTINILTGSLHNNEFR